MRKTIRHTDLEAACRQLQTEGADPDLLANLRAALDAQYRPAPIRPKQPRSSKGDRGGHLRFGYHRYLDTVKIDEGEKFLLKEMVTLHEEGMSYRAIAKWMNDEGYRTKSDREDALWHASTVRGILAHLPEYRTGFRRHGIIYPPILSATTKTFPGEAQPRSTLRQDLRRRPAPDAILQLQISLKDIEPLIWRRFVVRATMPVRDLAQLLPYVMGWDGDHLTKLHLGLSGNEAYAIDRDEEAQSDAPLYQVLTIGHYGSWLYDFGDQWEHTIMVEEELPNNPRAHYPRITAGKRACPPEDSGGPWIFMEYLDALAHPGRRGNRALRERMGKGYNPREFKIGERNRAIEQWLKA